MSDEPGLSSERARELGRRSGQARRRLTVDQVERDLGELRTVDDAERRLERLGVWCAAGLVSGSQGGAAVRACEVWIRAHTEQVDRVALATAYERIAELEREVGRFRAGLAQLRLDPQIQEGFTRLLTDRQGPHYAAAVEVLAAFDDDRPGSGAAWVASLERRVGRDRAVGLLEHLLSIARQRAAG